MNQQGSPEWFAERCGYATASEFSAVQAKGQGKTRGAYLRRVVAEILTGKPSEGYKGPNTDRGTAQEPFGRMDYEAATGNIVQEVGFIKHPTIARVGCSPDGLIDADGGIEIKSVLPTVQVDTILAGGYPSEHRPQIQGCMWITGRSWWDFASYSPDFRDERLRLYVFRVERDEAYIRNLEAEVVKFVREAEQLCDVLLGGSAIASQLQASIAKITGEQSCSLSN